MLVLSGHVSQETAHVTADYPYGFRLRCQRRVWLETTKKGTRSVFQTSNPKKSFLSWNKPKASTYAEVRVLVQLEESDTPAGEESVAGHIESRELSMYDNEEKIDAFVAKFGAALTELDQKRILVLRAMHRAQKNVKVTIVVNGRNEDGSVAVPQSHEEQQAIMRRATMREVHAMRGEAVSGSERLACEDEEV